MNPSAQAAALCHLAEEALHQDDDLPRTRQLLAEALALDESYFPALMLRAELELAEENHPDALDDADEAHTVACGLCRDDDIVISRIQSLRGHALLELGRFHEACLVLREAQLLVERAKAEGAATEWAQALGSHCTSDLAIASVAVRLADALAFTGRTDEAIDLLNSSILFAATPDAYLRLARLHEQRGDYRTAADHWRAAGPDYAILADPRERARLVGSDLAEAYALREQDLDAANFDPDDLHHELEFPYSALDPDTPEPVVTPTGRAIQNAEAAAGLDPSDYHPHTLLSEICDFLYLPVQRLAHAERAAQLAASRLADAPPRDPDEAEPLVVALLGAVVAFNEVRRYEDALIYASAAHTAYPDHLEAALIHASTLSSLDRHAEAEQILRTAVSHHPDDPQLHGQLAEVLHQLGRDAEAYDLLQRAETLCHEPKDFLHVSLYYGRLNRWHDSVRSVYLSTVASGSPPRLAGADYLAYAEGCAAVFEQTPRDREARARLLSVLLLACYYVGTEEPQALFLAMLYPEGPRLDAPLIERTNRELESRLLDPPRKYTGSQDAAAPE